MWTLKYYLLSMTQERAHFLHDQNLNGIGPRLYLDVDQPMTCDRLNQFRLQIECEETDKEIKIGRLIKDSCTM